MPKLLFVDDEPNIRLMYDAVFTKEGHATLLAGGGDEALALVEANDDIDLVVLDIKMKDRSGLEVLQDIVKQKRKIPVILCSAYSLYKDDFSSWLAEGYVVKSSSLDELKAEIKTVLKKYGKE